MPETESGTDSPIKVASAFYSNLSPGHVTSPLPGLFSAYSETRSGTTLHQKSVPSPANPLLTTSQARTFSTTLPTPPFRIMHYTVSVSLHYRPCTPCTAYVGHARRAGANTGRSNRYNQELSNVRQSTPAPPCYHGRFINISGHTTRCIVSSYAISGCAPVNRRLFSVAHSTYLIDKPTSRTHYSQDPGTKSQRHPCNHATHSVPHTTTPPRATPTPQWIPQTHRSTSPKPNSNRARSQAPRPPIPEVPILTYLPIWPNPTTTGTNVPVSSAPPGAAGPPTKPRTRTSNSSRTPSAAVYVYAQRPTPRVTVH